MWGVDLPTDLVRVGLFLALSLLLPLAAWGALAYQRRLAWDAATALEAPDPEGRQGPSIETVRRTPWSRAAGSWAVVSAPLLAYPFVGSAVPGLEPFLVKSWPGLGLWLQLLVGAFLWAPALAAVGLGLLEIHRFHVLVASRFPRVDPAGLRRERNAVNRVLLARHESVFLVYESAFAAWGWVAGVAILVAVMARPEWAPRVVLAVAVLCLLAVFYLRPHLVLGQRVASYSAHLRAHLEPEFAHAQFDALGLGGTREARVDAGFLARVGVYRSLPPSRVGLLVGPRLKTAVLGVAGPFLSIFTKLLAFG